FFYYTIRHPSTSTLFPYTTLFRSRLELLGKLILLLGRGAAPVAPHRERSHPGCVEIRHELRLDELLDLGRIACLELLVAADRRQRFFGDPFHQGIRRLLRVHRRRRGQHEWKQQQRYSDGAKH